ncbi:MAG: hypothetical protein RLZZ244_633 [Verrucomicrobiota bacterium]|jgi:hypothetical protein
MFRRILLEDWQRIAALSAWALFAFTFCFSVFRAFRLPSETLRHLERLPLDETPHPAPLPPASAPASAD